MPALTNKQVLRAKRSRRLVDVALLEETTSNLFLDEYFSNKPENGLLASIGQAEGNASDNLAWL